MQQPRKGTVKVELLTCAKHLWWCLHRIKSVRMRSFKLLIKEYLYDSSTKKFMKSNSFFARLLCIEDFIKDYYCYVYICFIVLP